MSKFSLAWLLVSFAFLVVPSRAESATASFALIVGVNQGLDAKQATLRYADDDAARYLELFRSLGAKTYVLSRLDENTRKLHPQAAAEAALPERREFEKSLQQISADVARARAQGIDTVFYFAYAGHGNVRNGEGYLALEDTRIDRKAISNFIEQIGAHQNHLIIDACYSYYLALERGPGGSRRPVKGFSEDFARRNNVGFLLSTSSTQESHEWEGFEAGIFSYEIRAGLYGAADADGDGQVSYREIAAFVKKANSAIANERFRPDVFAKPPGQQTMLVDLKAASQRKIHIDGEHHAHYLLEDSRGVKFAEFNNDDGQAIQLVRPPASGTLYVRDLDQSREYTIGSSSEEIVVASLEPTPVRILVRGAAHEAFSTIFSLPFGQSDVDQYVFRQPPTLPLNQLSAKKIAGWTLIGTSGAALILATTFAVLGKTLHDGADPSASQSQIADINQRIDRYNITSGVLFGTAAASAVVGAVLLLLPDKPVRWIAPLASQNSVGLSLGGAF